jgi:hypothetical protein
MNGIRPLALLFFTSCFFWLSFSAGVGLCRHSVSTHSVEFQNETALSILIPSKSVKSKLSNWLSKKPDVHVSLTPEIVQTGLHTLLKNRPFLNELSKHLTLEQAHADLSIESASYSVVAGNQPRSVSIEIKLELNQVRVKLDRPQFSIFGFRIPLFFLRHLSLPKSQTISVESKLDLQFSDGGEILSASSDHPKVAQFVKDHWNQKIHPVLLQSPVKISTLDVNPVGDFSVGLGLKGSKPSQSKTCTITCENFDFAVALNSATLPDLVREIHRMPLIQEKIRTSLPLMRLINVPVVRFLKSEGQKNLSFELNFQLQPLVGHHLRKFVNQDFIIHFQLQFHVRVDQSGQGLQIRMGPLNPHSIQFSETHFKRPLKTLAFFTPDFVKNGLHREILSIIEQQVRLNTKPIYFKDLKLPGMPAKFPSLQLVAVGLDPIQNHPYFAFKILDEKLN